MVKNDPIQTQLRILATNLEVLNQKITKNPEDILSPGEKVIEEKIEEIERKVNYLIDILKSTEIWNSLSKQKESIEEQIGKFEKIVRNLEKVDKPWINESLEKISLSTATAIETVEIVREMGLQLDNKLEAQKQAYFKGLNFKFRRLDKNLQLRLIIFMVINAIITTVGFIAMYILLN